MRLKSIVVWRAGNELRFGAIESIKTEESFDGTQTECAIRCEAESGLIYKDEKDLCEVYSGYDSIVSRTVDSIIDSLKQMYEKPSNESTSTGTNPSDINPIAPSSDVPF